MILSETKVDEAFKKFHDLICKCFDSLTESEYDEWLVRIKTSIEDEIKAKKN